MENNKRKYPCIEHSSEGEYYPLSFQQERVLYLSQLLPDNTYWNRIYCKRLKGKIDVPSLIMAIDKLAARHTVLKARIGYIDNKPVQFFPNSKENAFRYVDLSYLDESKQDPEALNLLNRECRTPIDVMGDQLFEAILLTLNENEHLLILKLHHIISDATTFRILWQDLKVIYNSFFEDNEALRELAVDYKDYALWQRKVFDVEQTREQENYWLEQFKEEIPVLDLPADFPPSSQTSFKGALEKDALPKELVKRLQAYSMKNRVALFSTLLAAYSVLLQKYCRQDNIVIGTVFAGRHYSGDIKNIAGFFINTVAMCMNVDDNLTFEEFVKETQKKVNEAYLMQDYPFERLIQKVRQNTQSQNPLFRTMFNMVNTYKENIGFFGIHEESWVEPEVNSTQSDLLFDVLSNNGDVELRIEYSTDVFRKETIKDILKHFICLLNSIVQASGSKILELDMCEREEQERFLMEWNNTYMEYPSGITLHELFEKQVGKIPDALAVAYEDKGLTYKELNEKANRLARMLREKGLLSNQLAGVMIDRSIDMIVGILGILKAGGAYLPIEPSYPADRIGYILQNSEVGIIVTQRKHKSAAGSGVEVIEIENDAICLYDGSNLDKAALPKDLAYTIYTSGSTGRPKGVMITHEAVVNTIRDINSKFSVNEKDRIIGLSSVSFDLSVYDIFGALSTGAALVEINDQRDAKGIIEVLERQRITVWNSVPAIMDMLVQNVKPSFVNTDLRLVLLSGDWIPLSLPEKIKKSFPKAEIISLGGATEASIWSIYHPIKEVKEEWSSIPYGRPLANQTFYVLDNGMKMCPYEARGELYIGGVGVALGYMNDREKTENAFINHSKFGFLYRTGDLGRFRREGYIEFLGRKDQQIKIRGYRVELGEIEKTLLSYPSVVEAVAIVREDVPGNKYIAAYLVARPETDISISELREHMKKWLPHYMVPAAIVKLEALTLSPNGKVDRKALPQPDKAAGTEMEYAASRNEIEAALCEIWMQLLKVEKIGIHDNFFALGGHSLLATQVLLRIRETLEVDLPLGKMLDLPSIADLAEHISCIMRARKCVANTNVDLTENREVGRI